jgi:hypothetical protein
MNTFALIKKDLYGVYVCDERAIVPERNFGAGDFDAIGKLSQRVSRSKVVETCGRR